MRRKLHVLALASILVIGGLAATSGPISAGDGFARYLQQQARDREQARAREQAHAREQARAREQAALSRSRSFTPKSVGARPKATTVSRPARPGTTSSPSAR
jgi:hypothetical protein